VASVLEPASEHSWLVRDFPRSRGHYAILHEDEDEDDDQGEDEVLPVVRLMMLYD